MKCQCGLHDLPHPDDGFFHNADEQDYHSLDWCDRPNR